MNKLYSLQNFTIRNIFIVSGLVAIVIIKVKINCSISQNINHCRSRDKLLHIPAYCEVWR